MAEIPPWLNVGPANYLQATEAGTQSGLQAGEIAHRAQEFSLRQRLERQQMAQQAAEASARQRIAEQGQGQQFQLSQMEMQTRKDIAAQNAQRMQAQQQMLNAYRQAQVGLGQDRLEQSQKLAEAKAQDVALSYRDEQGFSDAVANGIPVEQALFKFPRTRASIISALTRTGTQQNTQDTARWKVEANAALRNLSSIQNTINAYRAKNDDTDVIPPGLQRSLEAAQTQVRSVLGDKSSLAPPPPAAKPQSLIDQKVAKANELRKLHPDWKKDKIIEEVNKSVTGESAEPQDTSDGAYDQ